MLGLQQFINHIDQGDQNYNKNDTILAGSQGQEMQRDWDFNELGSPHEHHMNTKIWISLKFHARFIWNLSRAGNQARESKFIARTSQNPEKLENLEKQPKTLGFIDFSTLKINFRSADAANHVNRDAQHIPEVTRRAYIPKI